MAADFDFEALGLLDGLDGTARKERAELIQWLLDQGFSIEHICGSAAAPLMLPASKVLGDDGHYVSAREVSEATGIELELLQRLHGAIGFEVETQRRRVERSTGRGNVHASRGRGLAR